MKYEVGKNDGHWEMKNNRNFRKINGDVIFDGC